MPHPAPICNCNELNCPNNPCNHNQGCTPCIGKNLAKGEIPACFFRLVNGDLSQLDSFYLEDFVNFYLKHQNK